jgi:hypothetical protein
MDGRRMLTYTFPELQPFFALESDRTNPHFACPWLRNFNASVLKHLCPLESRRREHVVTGTYTSGQVPELPYRANTTALTLSIRDAVAPVSNHRLKLVYG